MVRYYVDNIHFQQEVLYHQVLDSKIRGLCRAEMSRGSDHSVNKNHHKETCGLDNDKEWEPHT
jgi:hypothetical protein